jgi:hypothetical protein
MKHERIEAYQDIKEGTLGAIENVKALYNFWVRTVKSLKVAADRNQLEEALTIFYILTVLRDSMAEVDKKLGKLIEHMSEGLLLKGFKNCGTEKEYIGAVTFRVMTPRQGRRAGKPRVKAD